MNSVSPDQHGHGHHHGHDGHNHGPTLATASAKHRRPLFISFLLIGSFFFVEAVAGFITNSLALLSDAGHMLTDVIGLGMALAAIQLAVRHEESQRDENQPASQHTFGLYRLEILAAFVNALLLFGIALFVLYEAATRFTSETPELLSGPMIAVAVAGLVVNLIVFRMLAEGSKESLNVEGAYLEVLADTLGSVAVIIAGVLFAVTGWGWIDPLFAVLIGLWILPRTFRLGRQAVRILIQAAPPHIDVGRLSDDLEALPNVVDVHDLHVWTLTSSMETVSAHLTASEDADHHAILDQARSLLADTYGIEHATFQVEPECHVGCHDVNW